MLRHAHRRSESGQAMLLAIGFLALLGIIASVVINLWYATESQRRSTEGTAARESVADGSAAFAIADTASQACGTVSGGTMQFPSSNGPADTLTYSVPSGSAGCGSVSGSGSAGVQCELCLLNDPGPSASPSTQLLNSTKGLLVNGEIDANGSLFGGGATVSATKINLWRYGDAPPQEGATCTASGGTSPACSPTPTRIAQRFTDPLAGALPLPTAAGPATNPSYTSGHVLIKPGVFSGLSISSGATVSMSSGLYVMTGDLNVSGGSLGNSDVSGSAQSDSGATNRDLGSGGSGDGDSTSVAGSATSNGTTSTITDTTKTWTAGQWMGNTVTVNVSGGPVTSVVQSNTSNSLTVSPPWSKAPKKGDTYTLSPITYTSTTLKDVARAWSTNQWAGKGVMVKPSSGANVTATVQSNTSNTLTLTAPWSTTPSLGNEYAVTTGVGYVSNGLIDVTKNWTPNYWANTVVTVTHAGGTVTGTVASSTSNALTLMATWTTKPSSGDPYVVSTITYTASPPTLRDSTKNWTAGQWANAVLDVVTSSGTDRMTVLTNSSNTLTMTSAWQPTSPSPGDPYSIGTLVYSSSPPSVTDTTKTGSNSWLTDQWKGAVLTVRLTGGATESVRVTGNNANTIYVSGWSPQPASGNSFTVVAPVVIYLGCSNGSTPYWSCDFTGTSPGGSVTTSGQGSVSISDYPPSPSGSYADIGILPQWEHFSIIADANRGGYVVSVSGNGAKTFGGNIYAPRGVMTVSGGGSSGSGATIGGRLILRSLEISGDSNSVLLLQGTGGSSSTPYCFIYNDDVSGTEASGATGVPRDQSTHAAHVRFETGCSSAGLNGQGGTSASSIIDYSYDGP